MPASSATASVAIAIENVSKSYKGIIRRKPVLADLSLEVRRGEVFGLIGPNGAGKTTLMLLCLGLLRPDRGSIRLLGSAPDGLGIRARIGYVSENALYYPFMRARRFLDLCGEMSGLAKTEREARALELAERFGLADALSTSVRKYSRGMLQKLALIQASQHDPDIYFLDEPTSGMDPVGVRAVREFIAEQRERGKTVFINSHMLAETERMCDRVAMMRAGSISEIFAMRPTAHCVRVLLLQDGFDSGSVDRGRLPAGLRLTGGDGGLQIEADDEGDVAEAITAIVAAGGRIRRVVDDRPGLEQSFFRAVEHRREG